MPDDSTGAMAVRNALVECFVEAQFDTMKASAERLGLKQEREDVSKMIEIQVREAFSRIGADYNHPKKEDFGRVMEVLAGKAAATGQASAVIEKHKAEMLALVSRLKE
jgi:hypothetical protein